MTTSPDSYGLFRLYHGEDGQSHFEDIEAVPFDVSEARFGALVPGRFADFHVFADRRLLISLSGEATITSRDGEVRHFGPGTVMLAEGQAEHQTRVSEAQAWTFMMVKLTD